MTITESKLNFLRDDAANALDLYVSLHSSSWVHATEQIELAAKQYITAQAKYTLACGEANVGSILDFVELP